MSAHDTDSATPSNGYLVVFDHSKESLETLEGLAGKADGGGRLLQAAMSWYERSEDYFVLLGYGSAVLYGAVPSVHYLAEGLVMLALHARKSGYDNLDEVYIQASDVTREIVRPLWLEVARQTAEEHCDPQDAIFNAAVRPADAALH